MVNLDDVIIILDDVIVSLDDVIASLDGGTGSRKLSAPDVQEDSGKADVSLTSTISGWQAGSQLPPSCCLLSPDWDGAALASDS